MRDRDGNVLKFPDRVRVVCPSGHTPKCRIYSMDGPTEELIPFMVKHFTIEADPHDVLRGEFVYYDDPSSLGEGLESKTCEVVLGAKPELGGITSRKSAYAFSTGAGTAATLAWLLELWLH